MTPAATKPELDFAAYVSTGINPGRPGLLMRGLRRGTERHAEIQISHAGFSLTLEFSPEQIKLLHAHASELLAWANDQRNK